MITSNCGTCTPCEGCEPEKIVCPEGMGDPCEICDPCCKPEICSYCRNGFCQCDLIVETADGPMHVDCAKRDNHQNWGD